MAELQPFNPIANMMQGQVAGQQRQNFQREQQLQSRQDEMAKIQFLNQSAQGLLGLPPEQRMAAFERLKPMGAQLGIDVDTIDTSQLTNDQALMQIVQSTNPILQGDRNTPAELQVANEFARIADAALKRPGVVRQDGTIDRSKLNASETQALQETGKLARIGTKTGRERAAESETLGSAVASQAGREAGAVESSRLNVQRKLKPQIEREVTLARKKAEAEGNVFTEFNQMSAALPGLNQVVDQLRELAPVATYTGSGRVFNTAAREMGFDVPEGATARAKFIAIVDNEILPLLRQTFGAAFTAQEGESLKATLGDPNTSPEEKMQQLDAFIESKRRQIETKERELNMIQGGQSAQPSGSNQEPSIEDLVNQYAQ